MILYMLNNGQNQDSPQGLSMYALKIYSNQFTATNQNIKLWENLQENALNLQQESLKNRLKKWELRKYRGFI